MESCAGTARYPGEASKNTESRAMPILMLGARCEVKDGVVGGWCAEEFGSRNKVFGYTMDRRRHSLSTFPSSCTVSKASGRKVVSGDVSGSRKPIRNPTNIWTSSRATVTPMRNIWVVKTFSWYLPSSPGVPRPRAPLSIISNIYATRCVSEFALLPVGRHDPHTSLFNFMMPAVPRS